MAEVERVLDIWVIETNTIYRDVPFAVVTDWVQQGRLLPEDKVRISKTEKWYLLGQVRAFRPYFPHPEPYRAEDQAEALEPISAGGLHWKRHADEEEDDPDMIPLIDVSLVLLIFFLMTTAASTAGVFSPIDTPPAKYQLATIGEDMYWVGIDAKSASGKVEKDANGWPVPWYSAGFGNTAFDLAKEQNLQEVDLKNIAPVINKLRTELDKYKGEVRLRIRASKILPGEAIPAAMIELQKLQAALNESRPPDSKLDLHITGEVSEYKRE